MDAFQSISAAFPGLEAGFSITSPHDGAYNCIAWAAGDSARWWWPIAGGYWPIAGVMSPTLDVFVQAFQTLGYHPCDTHELEPDSDKVAIYVGPDGLVTHMARQLETGEWTSKLGPAWDICHRKPDCVSGQHYGVCARILKRVRSAPV